MKILKMRIKRTAVEGRTHYDYPTPYYDAHKIVFGPIYEGGIEETAIEARARGVDDEFIIVGVKDSDAAQFLDAKGKTDPSGFAWDCVELTQAEAEAIGERWIKQTEQITDQSKVVAILAKVGRGEVLTQTEKNALNPDNAEVGVNKTKSFATMLQEGLDSNK